MGVPGVGVSFVTVRMGHQQLLSQEGEEMPPEGEDDDDFDADFHGA